MGVAEARHGQSVTEVALQGTEGKDGAVDTSQLSYGLTADIRQGRARGDRARLVCGSACSGVGQPWVRTPPFVPKQLRAPDRFCNHLGSFSTCPVRVNIAPLSSDRRED